MSIINQMLQDLDKRRAVNEVMPGAVRPLPEPPRRRISVTAGLLGGLAVIFVASGIIYVVWPQSHPGTRLPPAASATAAPLPLAQAVAAPAVPGETPVRVAARAEEASPKPSPVAKKSAVPPQAESEINPPDVSAGDASAKPSQDSAARNPVSTGSEPPAKPVAPPAEVTVGEAKRNGPRPGVGEAHIEKKMRVSSPRERAETEYQRGVNLLNAGRGSEATAAFNAALREDITYGAARAALAGLLIEQRRLDEAQTILQEGLAQEPQPALAMMLARLQTERGDLPAAASTLQTTLPAAADKAEYRALYAAVLQRAGRHAEATEHYAAALKLTPGNGVWWMGLGISLEAEGRIAEARQAFQSARAGGNLAPELAAYVEQRLRELQ